MKILVPVKRVADPDNANKVKISGDGSQVTSEGLEWKTNPFDEYAVEAALRITEDAPSGKRTGEVVVASIGPDDVTQQIRACLAMGAERGILVKGEDEKLDASVVARTIAKLYEKEKPDLVLLGKQAVDGDSNQVVQMLAEILGLPMVTFVASLDVAADGKSLVGVREVDGGALKLKAQLPAVVSVDLRIVLPDAVKNNVTPADKAYPEGPRYASLKGIMKAKKKPIDNMTLEDLGVDTTMRLSYLKFEAPPQRQAGVIVENAAELVKKLNEEARVL